MDASEDPRSIRLAIRLRRPDGSCVITSRLSSRGVHFEQPPERRQCRANFHHAEYCPKRGLVRCDHWLAELLLPIRDIRHRWKIPARYHEHINFCLVDLTESVAGVVRS